MGEVDRKKARTEAVTAEEEAEADRPAWAKSTQLPSKMYK